MSGIPTFFDSLEQATPEQRQQRIAEELPKALKVAQSSPYGQTHLSHFNTQSITAIADLAKLPVLRKSDLIESQTKAPPFGGLESSDSPPITYFFQSPGPIYEPGFYDDSAWQFARFLHACGIGKGDIVMNCFSYHLVPAGLMIDNASRTLQASVIPAGTGQSQSQAKAAAHIGATTYAGTPDYLLTILQRMEVSNLPSSFTKAAVSGGALFPQLRQEYADRGILCLQCYATADLGCIAYESPAKEGLICNENFIIEIVTPGTGDPVPPGEVGEIVVTTLRSEYPLFRFATGDMSKIIQGTSPCGRTNTRIFGWMGRADQTAKVKGMFIQPQQVAEFAKNFPEIKRVRLTVNRASFKDHLTLSLECQNRESISDEHKANYQRAFRNIAKISADIKLVSSGTLANDGVIIDDQRDHSVKA